MAMTGYDELREVAGVLYPGLFPEDAVRLHVVQIQRVAAWVEQQARELAAKAWDEGFDAGYLHVPGDPPGTWIAQ